MTTTDKRIVATYDYVDEDGRMLYQVVRYEPKDFRPRRRVLTDEPPLWIYNLEGVRRVLYRLPQVLDAIQAGRWIFFCEGEKDVDNMTAAGFVATTAQGSNSRNFRELYGDQLRGAHVCILPDNDDPGRKKAVQIAKALHGVANCVKIVALPVSGEKQDATDWLAQTDTPIDDMTALLRGVPMYVPPKPKESKPRKRNHEPNADWERKKEIARNRSITELEPTLKEGSNKCPFHDDDRPSLSIKGNLWYCFACDVGGDAISWVLKRDGVDFKEAVRRLQ